MTTAQIKSALDQVAARITAQRNVVGSVKSSLQSAADELSNISTEFGDAVTTINGYTPTGAFETLAKDELAKLVAEFNTLKTDIEAAIAAL